MGMNGRFAQNAICGRLILAKLFNFEISGLAHSFLMEIEENVNPGTGKRRFSKIPFENQKNTRSQIVACDSRDRNSTPISCHYYTWVLKQKGRP
jgi:hypothetical protein